MVTIEVNGENYEVPSNAADTNWAVKQVAFEQALAENLNDALEDIETLQGDVVDLETEVTDLSAAVMPPAVAGTPATGTGISGASTSYGRHVVHKITINSAAVVAAGVGPEADLVLWTLPAKTRVLRVVAEVTEAFQGGLISAVTLKVGRVGGSDDFLLPADVFTQSIVVGDTQDELGDNVVGGTGFVQDLQWSSQLVVANLVAGGADITELVQGQMTLYIEAVTYP